MIELNTAIQLWLFCYKYTAGIIFLYATGRFGLQDKTPYEPVMNFTHDISEYA